MPLKKDLLVSLYNKYREIRANIQHKRLSKDIDRRATSPNHILLVVVDALRPDYVPTLDGFSNSYAVTPGTWTFPAVTSIHSGNYPHQHGAVVHTRPDDEEFATPEQATVEHTLPEFAEQAGYDTYGGFAFVQPFLATESWYQTHRIYNDTDASEVLKEYQSWRKGRDQTFAYLHLSDLHIPVDPPDQYIEKYDVDTSIPDIEGFGGYTESYDHSDPDAQRFRKHRMRLYRAAVEYVTHSIQSLVDDFNEDILIIVTGDHGESLYEHPDIDRQFSDSRPNFGVGHGGTPFDKVARVPVVVSEDHLLPTGGVGSLVDIAATISREIATENPFGGYEWQNEVPSNRVAICEASRYGVERRAAYMNNSKIIRSKTDNITLTAVIDQDCEEFQPIPNEVEKQLVDSLPELWDDFNTTSKESRMVEDQLKALGYR